MMIDSLLLSQQLMNENCAVAKMGHVDTLKTFLTVDSKLMIAYLLHPITTLA